MILIVLWDGRPARPVYFPLWDGRPARPVYFPLWDGRPARPVYFPLWDGRPARPVYFPGRRDAYPTRIILKLCNAKKTKYQDTRLLQEVGYLKPANGVSVKKNRLAFGQPIIRRIPHETL